MLLPLWLMFLPLLVLLYCGRCSNHLLLADVFAKCVMADVIAKYVMADPSATGNNISPSHKVAIPSATDGNNISHHIFGSNINQQ